MRVLLGGTGGSMEALKVKEDTTMKLIKCTVRPTARIIRMILHYPSLQLERADWKKQIDLLL